jgi:hypothetical protein
MTIPVYIIHGDDDKVVPIKENSEALVQRYQQVGAADSVKLIVAKGQGHNFWEGFFRCPELVDFAVQQAKAEGSARPAGATTNPRPDPRNPLIPWSTSRSPRSFCPIVDVPLKMARLDFADLVPPGQALLSAGLKCGFTITGVE